MKTILLTKLLVLVCIQYSFGQQYAGPIPFSIQPLFQQQLTMEDDETDLHFELNLPDKKDINTCSYTTLSSIGILNNEQARAIIQYRNQYGYFLSYYELRRIPLIDSTTHIALIPHIYLSTPHQTNLPLSTQLKEASSTLYTRTSISTQQSNETKTQGYTQLIKGSYKIPGTLKAVFCMKKDKYEPIQWAPSKKWYGTDFQNFSLAIYNKGILKQALVGDFQIQLGQGLHLGGGFHPAISAAPVIGTYKPSPGLISYTSTISFQHFRGMATVLGNNWIETGFFVGKTALTASTQISGHQEVITTIGTGYHTTSTQQAKYHQQSRQDYGHFTQITLKNTPWHIGYAVSRQSYSLPLLLQKSIIHQAPVQHLHLASIYADGAFRGHYFFGESSYLHESKAFATTIGTNIRLRRNLFWALHYRYYDPRYKSSHAKPVGFRATTQNETGLYTSLRYNPFKKLSVSTYLQQYKQIVPAQNWSFKKGQELGLRFLYKGTSNDLIGNYKLRSLQTQKKSNEYQWTNTTATRQTFALTVIHPMSEIITLKPNIQATIFQEQQYSTGISLGIIGEVCPNKKTKINAGAYFFETNDFDSRIYLREKNLLYQQAFPMVYGKGVKSYVYAQYKATNKFKVELKYAHMNSLSPKKQLSQVSLQLFWKR